MQFGYFVLLFLIIKELTLQKARFMWKNWTYPCDFRVVNILQTGFPELRTKVYSSVLLYLQAKFFATVVL